LKSTKEFKEDKEDKDDEENSDNFLIHKDEKLKYDSLFIKYPLNS
jgi:hypothetical protein